MLCLRLRVPPPPPKKKDRSVGFFSVFIILLIARYSNKKWQYIDIVRLFCACMLNMYHCWADMILYIVLVVL